MGAKTDFGGGETVYPVQFPLTVRDWTFSHGHDPNSKEWFVQELLPGGKLSGEIDQGSWNNAYHVQFPFSVNDKQYIYGHNTHTNYWFIQRTGRDDKVGEETDDNHWDTAFHVQFPFSIHGKQYFYRQNTDTTRWFIQRLEEDGKMGKLTDDSQFAGWSCPDASQYPFVVDDIQFFISQNQHPDNTGKFSFTIRRINPGGRMETLL